MADLLFFARGSNQQNHDSQRLRAQMVHWGCGTPKIESMPQLAGQLQTWPIDVSPTQKKLI